MKIAFYTLGCKTNQYETQGLERLFAEKGHQIVAFSQWADIYIVNTCTVTALSDKKSRNACRRCKKVNPQAVLIVCGCYSQINPRQAMEACGADYVLGTADKSRIVEIAEAAAAGANAPGPAPTEAQSYAQMWPARPAFDILPAGGIVGRTRALLKVQDGCQSFCAYCLIPFARGPSRSVDIPTAAAQAASIAAAGYKELVVTGIEISSWGGDLPGRPGLIQLLDAVCAAAPGVRVRLGSLEPRTITEDFAAALARHGNVCQHFHLSLQSGCDSTLRAMNRKYTAERYQESCRILRRHFPGCAITTDLIVGFPGETEDDFERSLAFAEACGLAGMHVFPFSARRGTAAAGMPGQLAGPVKEARAARAAVLKARLEAQYMQGLVGQTLSVLFEAQKAGLWQGHSREYIPVAAPGRALANRVAEVRIEGVGEGRLLGRVLQPQEDKARERE